MKRGFAARVAGITFVAALTTAPRVAAAQEIAAHSGRPKPFETRQDFAVETRFSPYRPQVDDEPALKGKTPYKDTFGTMPRLLVQLELDWQALRVPHVGTLGPGVAVGYTEMTDKSFTVNGGRGEEDTSLTIYPMYGVAVLRADAVYRDLRIPLVPFAKAGVGYALWKATNPGGTSKALRPDGTDTAGKGHTWGTHFAVGVGLVLDALDTYASRNLDNTVGINHSYLTFEYYLANLNGLGQDTALRVGSSTWAMGLAFEF